LLLAPTLAGVSCASSPRPCTNCDAGPADLPLFDTVPDDTVPPDTGHDARPAAEVAWDAPAAALDAADGRPSATRDTPPGEAAWPTPLPDAGYLFFDEFQNARAPGWDVPGLTDRDAGLGGWSVVLGSSGSILAQGLLDQSTWHITYAPASSSADQIVEARLRLIDLYAETATYGVALFARYDPATDSGYLVALRGDGSLTLRRRDHGVTSSWGRGVAAELRTGVWYTVRLEAVGGALNAFLDGHPVYSVSDPEPLPAGVLALGTLGATVEVDRASAATP
jgi:hypothetical protein